MEFKPDPKFSFIIPIYDVPDDIFKRCLMSIENQDYPNIEVVIVPNGGDEHAEALAKEYAQGKENWKVCPIKEKGAPQARNAGFEASTGEIVSFFCSDYIANTGMVRMWVDKLLENPDCGFAYGAYEYNTQKREAYWSKSHDKYLLEVANYIDAGFPIWRKHVVPYDPEIKSLQDWDFWLSVVEKGVKGCYLGREISFIAEPPRPRGLSFDSMNNWMDRVGTIKKKHGIPFRDICVTSIGAPIHGIEIAKMIGADYRDDTLHKSHEYKALYLIGWYMKPGESENGHSTILKLFRDSVKIVHFVGADIYWLRKFSTEAIRQWAGAMKLPKLGFDHFLCENELAQEELKGYGIDAEIVPIPPYTDLEITPLPEEFKVALYLTDNSDFDKYLQRHTLSIVSAMPDVKFVGYGDIDLSKFKAKNFEHRGRLEKPEWIKFVNECSSVVRLVRHDTAPLAPNEFMIAGRTAVSNIPFECTEYIDTRGKELYDKWDTFAPGFSARWWPDTKAEIVRAIRKVRDNPYSEDFKSDLSSKLKERFNKERYIQTIHSLSKPKIKLEIA